VTRIIYWPATPWENPESLPQDFARAGPKPTTPEQLDAWLVRRSEIHAKSRSEGAAYPAYRADAASRRFHQINGHRALTWSSGYQRNEQRWTELNTAIYGEKLIASVSIQIPTEKLESVRAGYEQLAASVRLP